MADEDRFLEDDVAATDDIQSGKKVGLLPAVVIKLLKWAALIVAAIIFIVTVVVVTVSILGKGNQVSGYATISEQYQGKPPILEWYGNIEEIRGQNVGYDSSHGARQAEPRVRSGEQGRADRADSADPAAPGPGPELLQREDGSRASARKKSRR